MKINQKILDQIFAHAEKEGENEACGVLILVKGKMQYRPCKNISDTPMFTFSIDPYDHADAEDAGDIIAYVHSHPRSQPTPSWADKEGIEQTGLPWVIVNWRTRTHTINNPDGWVTPLKGREFIHGIHDCYGLIRDYYKQERGIILPDFERKHQWWLRGDNLFVENFTKSGFQTNSVRPAERRRCPDSAAGRNCPESRRDLCGQ